MKKIFLTTAVIAVGSLVISANAGNAYSGTDKGAKRQMRKEHREERREFWLYSADPAAEAQFAADFPAARNVSWSEGNFNEASFLDGTTEKTAYYDADNELVGTTANVAFSAIPEKARQKIDNKYPGYYVKQVVLFDDNEASNTDMYLFSASFADEDNYFPVITNGEKKIILKVSMEGDVSFFQKVK
jgi:hypothetical protein